LLAEHPKEALPLAGGTDLLVRMKQRRIVPRYVVNLKAIPGMDQITYDESEGLRIGALTAIQSLKNSVIVKRHFKILAQAAGVESSVQIRNVATLGGNIANASPAADAPLALTCDIERFTEGSALKRWVMPGWGATQAAISVMVWEKPGDNVLATFRSQSSVSIGGLYTIGADQYILGVAFDDIVKQMEVWAKGASPEKAP